MAVSALLRPFDAVSTALYAAAFRAGRRLGRQIHERCGDPSPPADVEGLQVAMSAPISALPGVTIESVEVDPFAPTPENCLIVDLGVEGDDAFHEARWADVAAAVEAGKAVVFAHLAADVGLFSVGRVTEGHYLVQVGIEPPCNYADLKAAMRHGISATEGIYHG